jgi:hypothetical protein
MSDKIIIREENIPGVDQSLLDFHLPPLRVKVIKKMFKKGIRTYIGLSEFIVVNQVIQVGSLGLKYRIISSNPKKLDRGYLFEIKRIDGFNITSTDINAVQEGRTALIIGRRSYQTKLEQVIKAIEGVQ